MVRVAASHRYGDGDAASLAGLEHNPIALGEAQLGYAEPAQAIALERVGAGEVDGEPRIGGVE